MMEQAFPQKDNCQGRTLGSCAFQIDYCDASGMDRRFWLPAGWLEVSLQAQGDAGDSIAGQAGQDSSRKGRIEP